MRLIDLVFFFLTLYIFDYVIVVHNKKTFCPRWQKEILKNNRDSRLSSWPGEIKLIKLNPTQQPLSVIYCQNKINELAQP